MITTYRRLRDLQDRKDHGTHTIQTSGAPWLTGEAVFTQDYLTHSYQVVAVGDGPWSGQFNVDISNDNVNYTCIYAQNVTGADAALASAAYSADWAFAYARSSITGTDGEFLINERHLAP